MAATRASSRSPDRDMHRSAARDQVVALVASATTRSTGPTSPGRSASLEAIGVLLHDSSDHNMRGPGAPLRSGGGAGVVSIARLLDATAVTTAVVEADIAATAREAAQLALTPTRPSASGVTGKSGRKRRFSLEGIARVADPATLLAMQDPATARALAATGADGAFPLVGTLPQPSASGMFLTAVPSELEPPNAGGDSLTQRSTTGIAQPRVQLVRRPPTTTSPAAAPTFGE